MAKIKSRKTKTDDTEGFNHTVMFEVLHCGNVEGNNNKFYCLEIQQNSKGHYRLFSHYGRLNSTNLYDVRDIDADGEHLTNLVQVEKEFNSILNKKKRGKTVTDKDGTKRKEAYTLVETVSPTVGSSNIKSVAKTVTSDKAAFDTSGYGTDATRLLNQFIRENIHSITSKTALTYTSNGFETPLGPVTKEHVIKSRQPLIDLKNLMKNNKLNPKKAEVKQANNEYFSLIPHDFGHKILQSDWILDGEKLAEEFELLEQLETAVAMTSSSKNSLEAFGTDIDLVTDKKVIARINKYFESSRASNHSNLKPWKLKNVFKIKIHSERERFTTEAPKYGNIVEVFHGSKSSNILSILKNGLIVPPSTAGHVAGRMFGDGVYGAINSTKALNYSLGYWSSSSSSNSNAFLFLADFAMGKVFECDTQQYNGAPSGFDSVHAKKGRSLYNDELIVYDLEQQTLKYLIELEER